MKDVLLIPALARIIFVQLHISVFSGDLIPAENLFHCPDKWLFAEKTPEGKEASAELKKFLSLDLINFGVNGNSFKIIANGLVHPFLQSVVTNIVLNTATKSKKESIRSPTSESGSKKRNKF